MEVDWQLTALGLRGSRVDFRIAEKTIKMKRPGVDGRKAIHPQVK